MFAIVMNRILLLLCIIMTLLFVCTRAQVCDAGAERQFDANIARLLTIGNSGRRFPEDKELELKKFCNESANLLNKIEGYKKQCLTGLPLQVTGVLIFAVKNTIKQLCRKNSKRLDIIIEATPCANAGNAEINKCYTKMIDGILGVMNVVDDKKKIPLVCCQYFSIFPCMRTRLKRINVCNSQKIEALVDFANSISGNVVNLLCAEYENSDKCHKLGGPPKKRRNQRRTKSFALPMINVFKSFPEV